jgi:uncharacterized protein
MGEGKVSAELSLSLVRLATVAVKNANLVSSLKLGVFAIVAAVAVMTVSGCGRKAGTDSGSVKTVQDYFPLKVGGVSLQAQFAVYMHEMQQGLMNRRDLGANQGMIFVYANPQRMGFYMKNTPTPLDIGFFNAEGVLQEVHQLVPFDERTVSSASAKLKFALEMNKGWFAANGIRPGAQLDMKAVRAAMKARGFDLIQYGLEDVNQK